jgi:hypothetical protein
MQVLRLLAVVEAELIDIEPGGRGVQQRITIFSPTWWAGC